MNRSIHLFAAILLIALCGCEKFPGRGESVNRGDIIENFQHEGCVALRSRGNDEWVIRNLADVDTSSGTACVNEILNFDFNSFSIIGKTISYDCSAGIIRELSIDHERKEYLYTIRYKERGVCKKMGVAHNQVVVPRIPDVYQVTIDAQKK